MLEIKKKRNIKGSLDSLSGCVQISLSIGPIYFNYFLNLSIHIKDNNVLRVLNIDIKTYNFDTKERNIKLAFYSLGL